MLEQTFICFSRMHVAILENNLSFSHLPEPLISSPGCLTCLRLGLHWMRPGVPFRDIAHNLGCEMLIKIVLVEDGPPLRQAMQAGLEATGHIEVLLATGFGEQAVDFINRANFRERPEAVLMDVQLAGEINGIEAAVAIRREQPRFPVVFYSIQDDDAFFRAFRLAGILSHYAYVRKTNYLLPEMVVPLVRDAVSGRSFIDPEIEARVLEVQQKDEQDPMALLEPHEQVVARLLADGLSNEQIAAQMGYKDKRTISRMNGQIYTVWGLRIGSADEKIARTRAALIVRTGRLLRWDESGKIMALDKDSSWTPYDEEVNGLGR
jgi:DNA-binding NarL/FixJ family response regulator